MRGSIRTSPEDFQVTERLGFEPTGAGEHLLLWVEKRAANTAWVAARLAEYAGVAERECSYAGRKDRHAVARQWFGLRLPGRAPPDWAGCDIPGVRILDTVAHDRKLRRGALRANHFDITVRDLAGDSSGLEARLGAIGQGVPNYFGPQRFGRHGSNLLRAQELFDGGRRLRRATREMALSAARSFLFNIVLARRVRDDTWARVLPGEAVSLAGSNAFFVTDEVDAELEARVVAADVHPSGPLWGRGTSIARGVVAAIEDEALQPFGHFAGGLEQAGLRQARRALRVVPEGFEATLTGSTLRLRFALPAGAFATAVLQEIADVVDASQQPGEPS